MEMTRKVTKDGVPTFRGKSDGFNYNNKSTHSDSKKRPKGTLIPFVLIFCGLISFCYFVITVITGNKNTLFIPPIEVDGRVMELVHGEHFDDVVKDTPDEMRPPGLIAFYGSHTCGGVYKNFSFEKAAQTRLPARERLFIAKYDYDVAPHRVWYKFTPERDLAARMKVSISRSSCPALVFIPRSCDGWTKWCVNPNGVVGCKDYKESCSNPIQWDGKGDWVSWVENLIEKEGEPEISHFLDSYSVQGTWLRSRDKITTTTHLRNNYLSPLVPNFTETGAVEIDCPDELWDSLIDIYKRFQNRKHIEYWPSSGTQNSGHVSKMYFVDHNLDPNARRLAIKHLQPVMEAWSNMKLQFTSFYGIREYHPKHWLRGHVDRIDELVISATICVDKIPLHEGENVEDGIGGDPWPLEIVNYKGENIRFPHPKKKVILYESAKIIHGRPIRNPVGMHLGAFLHFKPVDIKWWDSVVSKARNEMHSHQHHVPYVSTPSVEPTNPVYTKQTYGDETEYEGAKFLPHAEIVPKQTLVSYTFQNKMEKSLQLHYHGPNGIETKCLPYISPEEECNIKAYGGQVYGWGEIPVGHEERERGFGVYIPESKFVIPFSKDKNPKRISYYGGDKIEHSDL